MNCSRHWSVICNPILDSVSPPNPWVNVPPKNYIKLNQHHILKLQYFYRKLNLNINTLYFFCCCYCCTAVETGRSLVRRQHQLIKMHRNFMWRLLMCPLCRSQNVLILVSYRKAAPLRNLSEWFIIRFTQEPSFSVRCQLSLSSGLIGEWINCLCCKLAPHSDQLTLQCPGWCAE